MRKLAEGYILEFKRSRAWLQKTIMLIMHSPNGLRNLFIQRNAVCAPLLRLGKARKKMLAKCIGKTNESVNLKS